ncbi:MAG: tRNA lysidine(34) synthetase TilS [Verrucomicrobiota bacterium]
MVDLLSRIEESIRSRRLFRRGQRILVAVSGGGDSMVLLRLLRRLSATFNWKLVVAHFNHQLRGASSDADERLVQEAARKLDLKTVVGRGDVKEYQQANGVSLEMASRKLRHDFLAATASQLGIDTVAVAHHADDQVEHFFLRLFRGSGGGGLAGMKWSNPSPSDSRIRLVRPLLGQTKKELAGYARQEGIPFREDATNASLDGQRNRIRNELVPLLTKEYQPALVKTTLRLMDILGANADFVRKMTEVWLRTKRRKPFSKLDVAIQRQCLQLGLFKLGIEADFELIERLRRAPKQKVSANSNLLVMRDATGQVDATKVAAHSFNSNELSLDVSPGQGKINFAHLEINWRISAVAAALPSRRKLAAACEYFDADKIGSTVRLRHWQPGDRFHPIGMSSSVKLQDLLTNRKIPSARRRELVVATTSTSEIFWVEGLRISEDFKLDKTASRRLRWSWRRPTQLTG